MAVIKNIPMRQCAGCRTMFDKRTLIRVVRDISGAVALDSSSKMAGRGVYICKNSECLKKAEKTKAVQRALKCEVPADIYENLRTKMEELSCD